MSHIWVSQQERSNSFWLRTIIWIARHLGRTVARGLLYPITAYFVATSPASRKASRQFLHLALEQLAKGKGAILLGSHLGSFEALRVLGTLEENLSLKVLMIEEHNQMITELLNILNPDVASSVIPVGQPDTFLRVKEALDQQEMIGILGDRTIDNDRETRCEFFGHPASFPLGPLQMAAVLKAPVILFYGLYQGGNRYDVRFHLLTEGIDISREKRMQKVQELTCEYARQLENNARQAPLNWFNFYDYWAD